MVLAHTNFCSLTDLPEGSCRDVLIACEAHKHITPDGRGVSSRSDRLWADALNVGAYDFLMKPLDASELARVAVIASAFRVTPS